MQEGDFVFVKQFLDNQRSRLNKIEFFYPYKDFELKAVLKSGYFWGLLDSDELIATFAIDLDKEYAKELAELINSFNNSGLNYVYESSGLMVAEKYRGQGIAKYLLSLAIEKARDLGIAICGVVHTQNVASMSTFFSLGFQLRAIWHMSENYDFVYLLKNCEKVDVNGEELILKKVLQSQINGDKIKNIIEVINTDTKEHSALLSEGYVGIGCRNNLLYFSKKGELKL